MLEELNQYIAEHYTADYILEVRAIGGFSMIIHKMLGEIDGPREKSQDIDSLTDDYPEEIVNEIKRIGEKYGANDEDGWLNNHWNQTKKYNEEFAFFIRWKELDSIQLSNIKIYYADLESLFMFKIRAIDDRIALANTEPRQQDVVDAISILRAYGISDLTIISNESIKHTLQYFPNAVNYFVDNNMVLGNRIATGVPQSEDTRGCEQ